MRHFRVTRQRAILFALVILVVPTVAIAGSVLVPPASVSGSNPAPIFKATNTGSGNAISAISSSSTNATLKATNMAKTGGTALVGLSTGNAIQGTSTQHTGIVGSTNGSAAAAAGVSGIDQSTVSTQNVGVHGRSARGIGVFGEIGQGFSGALDGIAAVEGVDNGDLNGDRAIGVEAFSLQGIALEADAQDQNSTAIIASAGATGGLALDATGGQAPFDTAIVADAGGTGISAFGSSTGGSFNSSLGSGAIGLDNGEGVQANGFSSSPVPALNAACFSGGPAMTATNHTGSSPFDIMSLDCSGNMILAGKLTQSGTPLVARRNTAGIRVGTFSAQQTMATIEDLGEAQLVNGRSYVQLAPDFAATIDQHTNYLVFITPQGESRGLYVTKKTSAGFAVRENGGGNSTLTFDYRVVAKPYGELSQRLPTLRVNMHPDPSMIAVFRRAIEAKEQMRTRNATAHARILRDAARVRLQAKALKSSM